MGPRCTGARTALAVLAALAAGCDDGNSVPPIDECHVDCFSGGARCRGGVVTTWRGGTRPCTGDRSCDAYSQSCTAGCAIDDCEVYDEVSYERLCAEGPAVILGQPCGSDVQCAPGPLVPGVDGGTARVFLVCEPTLQQCLPGDRANPPNWMRACVPEPYEWDFPAYCAGLMTLWAEAVNAVGVACARDEDCGWGGGPPDCECQATASGSCGQAVALAGYQSSAGPALEREVAASCSPYNAWQCNCGERQVGCIDGRCTAVATLPCP